MLAPHTCAKPCTGVCCCVAALAPASASAQRGAMTVPRNLDQLTDRASDIVRGTVVEARVEKHPELRRSTPSSSRCGSRRR